MSDLYAAESDSPGVDITSELRAFNDSFNFRHGFWKTSINQLIAQAYLETSGTLQD